MVQMEYGAYFADLVAKNFEAIVVGNTPSPDPVDYVYNHFHTNGMVRISTHSPIQTLTPKDEARSTVDPEALKALLGEIQQMVCWDAGAPYQYAYNALNLEGLRNRVQGYVPDFSAMRRSLVRSWIQE
ncbi:MAG: hypothetical protein R2845_16230 [Thermomicrobiales bacterium]